MMSTENNMFDSKMQVDYNDDHKGGYGNAVATNDHMNDDQPDDGRVGNSRAPDYDLDANEQQEMAEHLNQLLQEVQQFIKIPPADPRAKPRIFGENLRMQLSSGKEIIIPEHIRKGVIANYVRRAQEQMEDAQNAVAIVDNKKTKKHMNKKHMLLYILVIIALIVLLYFIYNAYADRHVYF